MGVPLFSFRSQRGFSLIELLVVIAIIGILIALVYVNFQEARKNTRDKVRQTTLVDIQLALESYKAQVGRYPAGLYSACSGATSTDWITADAVNLLALNSNNRCDVFINGLVPSYIDMLPSPAQRGGAGFYYKTDGAGNAYKLMVYNQVEGSANQVTGYDKRFAACPSSCTGNALCGTSPDPETYAVYSPGGECF